MFIIATITQAAKTIIQATIVTIIIEFVVRAKRRSKPLTEKSISDNISCKMLSNSALFPIINEITMPITVTNPIKPINTQFIIYDAKTVPLTQRIFLMSTVFLVALAYINQRKIVNNISKIGIFPLAVEITAATLTKMHITRKSLSLKTSSIFCAPHLREFLFV